MTNKDTGIAQVIDDLGNPLVMPADRTLGHLPHFVSLCRHPARFVGLFNTLITPAKWVSSRPGYPQKPPLLRRVGSIQPAHRFSTNLRLTRPPHEFSRPPLA